MYYKAEIFLSSETFINNDQNQGCDPDSFSDQGIIQTLTSSDLKELLDKIKKQYGSDIEDFDEYLITSSVETERDGTKYLATYSIYIEEVETKQVNNKLVLNILKKAV